MSNYTPNEIEALEYDSWIQEQVTEEEYDEQMSALYANYRPLPEDLWLKDACDF